jgi:hypothetical protein
MELIICGVCSALAGGGFAAWRLRGEGETFMQALRRVMPMAGPRPVVPK